MATSKDQSGFVDSWQNGKTLAQCNLHMLETGQFSDVSFRVGSDGHVIKAHRYVLVSRSCVFNAMFCGQMAEPGEITIPDIEADIFKDFLIYIYSDSVAITADNVTGLLYTSRKYDVQALFEDAASFLEKSLCEENAADILEQSHFYNELDLESKALEYLTKAGMKLVNSPGFLDLCTSCFDKFVQSRKLNLGEEEVFTATLNWTKAQCKKKDLSPTHTNMRKILGRMVHEIRFVTFSLDFLVKTVGPSEILTLEERVRFMDRLVDPSFDVQPFKSEGRGEKQNITIRKKESETFYVERFGSNYYYPFPCVHTGTHAISFSPSTNIILLGCQPLLYYVSTPVDMTLYGDQDQNIAGPVTCYGGDVLFSDPVLLQTDKFYTICINISHEVRCLSVGQDGKQSVSAEGVTFKFKNSPQSAPQTNLESGLINTLICRHTE